jgi:hypothetical protein
MSTNDADHPSLIVDTSVPLITLTQIRAYQELPEFPKSPELPELPKF